MDEVDIMRSCNAAVATALFAVLMLIGCTMKRIYAACHHK